MVDVVLLIAAILCLLLGFVGCIVPALPGPPIGFAALLLIKFARWGADASWTWIVLFGALTLLVTVLDYWIPAWGTKKFGGTRGGVWGASIGMVVGLFFPPAGIILGPFIGAFTGEMIAGTPGKKSIRAAFGAFLGFLGGIGMKVIVCICITIYFISICI
jgi:uncharacterized protein YqgC (DUF456 family)